MDVDTTSAVECVDIEIDAAGKVLRQWNLAEIISRAMLAGGDDPTQFVAAPPVDWFHNNCVAYRAADNTLVVSSRENFVIALDYDTQAIKWIFGDPTKKWYSFPSLRRYALGFNPGTHPPIGQHALSFDRNRLLLFDNGAGSLQQMPAGLGRNYSAPRMYRVSVNSGTVTEVWNFLGGKQFYSPFCSSVYSDQPNNYLIDYAVAGPFLYAELLGLDSTGATAFHYRYKTVGCGTAWNAVPIHLENLVFD